MASKIEEGISLEKSEETIKLVLRVTKESLQIRLGCRDDLKIPMLRVEKRLAMKIDQRLG